ncbi:MAG: MucBP domain-containing protein [Turicibacter sp.]|nr:MucBP domain-containing protein [Turicibacter sp.]
MVTTQKYQVTVINLAVKNKQNIFASTIAILPKGTIIEVIKINWLWVTIIYNNKTAYVYSYGLTRYIEEIKGSVTIQYIDYETGETLQANETYSHLSLGSYSYNAKTIEGFSLISDSKASVTLTTDNPNQIITFKYTRVYGSVTIQYLADGVVLLSDETQSQLELNTYTYDAPFIDGYELITTTPISVTITVQQSIHTITFDYKKEEETEFLPLDESLQNEVPYISTYYIKPIVVPGEEVVIDYYITDYYHKEYTDDDYSGTFVVTVHIEDHPDIILRNLKAGDHSVSLSSFTFEREQKFSILCTDQYGRNSHELFNFFLVRTEPEVK